MNLVINLACLSIKAKEAANRNRSYQMDQISHFNLRSQLRFLYYQNAGVNEQMEISLNWKMVKILIHVGFLGTSHYLSPGGERLGGGEGEGGSDIGDSLS